LIHLRAASNSRTAAAGFNRTAAMNADPPEPTPAPASAKWSVETVGQGGQLAPDGGLNRMTSQRY
jgi:hypothetical protein